MSHQQLRLETCPNFLFDEPWEGTVLAHAAQLSKRDALATEHLATLNAAFCRFYARVGCSPLPERCGGSAASAFVVQLVHGCHRCRSGPPLRAGMGVGEGASLRRGTAGWHEPFDSVWPRLNPTGGAHRGRPAHDRALSSAVMSKDRPLSLAHLPALASGCLSWPIRAKQWHAASGKDFNTGDEAEMCASWARMGECSKNPLFMHRSA